MFALFLFFASFSISLAAPQQSFPDLAKQSGWDVVANQLQETINQAKNEKKLQKQLRNSMSLFC